MTDDKLSFLDDKPTDPNAATEAAQAADPAPVETPEIVEENQTPAQVTEPQPQREDHNPLLPKYLDTYNKLRDAERRIADFEEKQKEKAATPDPVLDPEGYSAHQEKVFNEKIWDATARTSEIAARRYYGEETVQSAFEALKAQNDPLLGMHIRRSADPWEEIVRWHYQQLLLAEVGNDPAAYRQRVISDWQAQQQKEAEQKEAEQAAQVPLVPTPPAKAPLPPASLSKAPASKAKASDVPTGPGNAFDNAFAQ